MVFDATQEQLRRHLSFYLDNVDITKAHGVSNVQRVCRIGYNQSCRLIEKGLELGYLKKDDNKEWLHIVAS